MVTGEDIWNFIASDVTAAWVQAVGSIIAIGAAYHLASQSERARKGEAARVERQNEIRIKSTLEVAQSLLTDTLQACHVNNLTYLADEPSHIISELLIDLRSISNLPIKADRVIHLSYAKTTLRQMQRLLIDTEQHARMGSIPGGTFTQLQELIEYADERLRAWPND